MSYIVEHRRQRQFDRVPDEKNLRALLRGRYAPAFLI